MIGAGASGLAAAAELTRAGKSVYCLEASGRIGGRVYTVRDPLASIPIELGAEFIHGRPRETFDLVEAHRLPVYEHDSEAVFLHEGRVQADEGTGEAAGRILEKSKATARHDETFEQFLQRSRVPGAVKERAIAFIEGFNAARKERVSTAALIEDAKAAEEIEGDRAFRILSGYDSLMHTLGVAVRLHTIVERVQWKKGRVRVHTVSGLDGARNEYTAPQAIVTVSLGVLKSGAIEFRPAPKRVLAAARKLEFGQVSRVTFRFDRIFWQDDPQLASSGFWVSREPLFPTWWTPYPVLAPLLTGWSAGPAGERLQGKTSTEVIAAALDSLGRILNREIPRPAAAHFHDWHADPFHRGAYSYVPAGALDARRALGEPVEQTLFFAGEATSTEGHGGTVHGAIASGRRAARLALDAG